MSNSKLWKYPILATSLQYPGKPYFGPGHQPADVVAGSVPHYAEVIKAYSYPLGLGGGIKYVDQTLGDWGDAHFDWVSADALIQARLKLDKFKRPNGFSKFVTWTATDGRNFPMFVGYLTKLLRETDYVEPFGWLEGRFKVVKRSKCFGIEFVSR